MTSLAWLGVGLLVAGGVVIVVEFVVAAIWTARVSKRSRELARWLEAERRLTDSELARLRLAIEETRRLWEPYRRWLRFMRHPLVAALTQSFLRRYRAAARG